MSTLNPQPIFAHLATTLSLTNLRSNSQEEGHIFALQVIYSS